MNAQTSQGSTWQSAAQGGSQSNSTWQSAAQNESQGTNAWQSAPQNSSQGSTASWNAQASAQGGGQQADSQNQDQHHTTGGWAWRRPEFSHESIRNRNMQNAADAAWQEKLPVLPQQPFCLARCGGTMFAVNTTGEYLKGQYTTIGQTETQAQVKVEPSDDGSSTTSGARLLPQSRPMFPPSLKRQCHLLLPSTTLWLCSSRPGSDRVRP